MFCIVKDLLPDMGYVYCMDYRSNVIFKRL